MQLQDHPSWPAVMKGLTAAAYGQLDQVRNCRACSSLPVVRGLYITLEKHGQPVAYKAVAGLFGHAPNGTMARHPRNHLHSFVVGQDGAPSGYETSRIDPRVAAGNVIVSSRALFDWLCDLFVPAPLVIGTPATVLAFPSPSACPVLSEPLVAAQVG
jgi:hypothetical protein